jgi:hypothetical protein
VEAQEKIINMTTYPKVIRAIKYSIKCSPKYMIIALKVTKVGLICTLLVS